MQSIAQCSLNTVKFMIVYKNKDNIILSHKFFFTAVGHPNSMGPKSRYRLPHCGIWNHGIVGNPCINILMLSIYDLHTKRCSEMKLSCSKTSKLTKFCYLISIKHTPRIQLLVALSIFFE